MGVQAASDGDPRRSALLVQYVLNVFSCEKMLCMPLRDAVKSPDVRAWFQSVAALPLVEAERTGHAVQYTQKKLYAFEEVRGVALGREVTEAQYERRVFLC